jgi:drug/metabolite transporter (DMT)-like permease
MKAASWLRYTLLTTVMWGVWGAFTSLPSEHGFPDTLTYVVWALTMIAPALWAIRHTDTKFHLIFPIVSLSPVITILLSMLLLRERTGRLGMVGIALAVISLPLFDYSPNAGPHDYGGWFLLAMICMAAWGLQAYLIKLANATMSAESIFVYMMVTGLLFIPVAVWFTDFSKPVNMGLYGPWLAAAVQILNAIGALLLVYAFRYGKAIVVSPLVNACAPLMTAVIALAIAGALPGPYKLAGAILALAGSLLLSLQPE